MKSDGNSSMDSIVTVLTASAGIERYLKPKPTFAIDDSTRSVMTETSMSLTS